MMSDYENIRELIKNDSEFVNTVRTNFLARVDTNSELYDSVDVEKVRVYDWKLWRFLRPCGYNTDEALDKLDKAMKWRKEHELSARSDADVPKEFFEAGGIFEMNRDKYGSPVIYLRVRVNLKITKLSDFVKAFITFIINKVDERTNENGFVIVLDLSNAGIRNVDMDLLSYLVSTLKAYFPEGMRYCLVYNLPWLLRQFWPIVKLWLTPRQQRLVKFANGDQIMDYIDRESLPQYLGGLCADNFAVSPLGCKSVIDMGTEFGFTDEEVQYYYKMYESIIKETQCLFGL